VADFVRHRLGQEALDVLIDPLVGGIHAGDPEQLSMRACFPRLVELVERHGSLIRALRATRGEPAPSVMKPEGGNQTLVDALVAGLGERLQLSTPVSALSRAGARWRVETPRGGWEAARVVLALPMRAASELLIGVAPQTADTMRSIDAESVVSFVHVHRRADVTHRLDGFGYLAASSERLLHLGTLFSSSISPGFAPEGEVLLRTFLGGARHPEVVEADDARLHEIVAAEVGPLLGLRGAPRWSAIDRYPAIFPRYDLAHPRRVADIERSLPAGLSLLGNYLRGIGVNHLVATARQLARNHE
jgi:oxygen-dependent protoporphyrinogen oxidase